MLGIEMVDGATGEPSGQAAASVQRASIERGLIVELGGRGNCVVRLTPPLLGKRRLFSIAPVLSGPDPSGNGSVPERKRVSPGYSSIAA